MPHRDAHRHAARRMRRSPRPLSRARAASAGLINLHGLGQMLVRLRAATGVTQRELAERLGVHTSQVSRDERTGYHGITVERASRVLDALGVYFMSLLEEPPLLPT